MIHIKYMYSIALLIPVCSRGKKYETIENTPFSSIFYPNFLKTYNPEHKYTIYIGIDSTDNFYKLHMDEFESFSREKITIKTNKIKTCQYNYQVYFTDLGFSLLRTAL